MESILDNFAYLIQQFGHIPNGNRTYFVSRSQPPYFSLMLDLLASDKGNRIYLNIFLHCKRSMIIGWTKTLQHDTKSC